MNTKQIKELLNKTHKYLSFDLSNTLNKISIINDLTMDEISFLQNDFKLNDFITEKVELAQQILDENDADYLDNYNAYNAKSLNEIRQKIRAQKIKAHNISIEMEKLNDEYKKSPTANHSKTNQQYNELEQKYNEISSKIDKSINGIISLTHQSLNRITQSFPLKHTSKLKNVFITETKLAGLDYNIDAIYFQNPKKNRFIIYENLSQVFSPYASATSSIESKKFYQDIHNVDDFQESLYHNTSFEILEVKDGYSLEDIYQLYRLYVLILTANTKLPSDTMTTSIAELMYIQTKDLINNDDDKNLHTTKKDLSESVKHFIKSFNPAINGNFTYTKQELSLLEFRQFLEDVKLGNKIQSNVINWLLPQERHGGTNESPESEQKFVSSLLDTMSINDILTKISKAEISNIINELDKDSGFKQSCEILDVYKINSQKSNKDYNPNAKHKLLTHGTSNSSVLTILRDGLLTRAEIHSDAIQSFTGLGLGDGIYFARPDQAGKSSSYSNRGHFVSYLFIADVAYTETYNLKHYATPDTDDWDLIHAHKVGAQNRDELVARYSNQVELKYMIAFTTH